MRHVIRIALLVLAAEVAIAGEPAGRTLTFEDRVKAQEAIERVYYSHQIGTTKSFEQAVPRAVLEGKVRKYLDQTAALKVYWKTDVRDEMLQRELERMAHGTKLPERLLELYQALGDDPFRIKECLARATLVDRLTHNFYAFDGTRHAEARASAEALHRELVSGERIATAAHPSRTVTRVVLREIVDPPSPESELFVQSLAHDEFRKYRTDLPAQVGQPSRLQEASDSFSFSVLLSESATELRIATYSVAKTPWDAWWLDVHAALRGQTVPAVASSALGLPQPIARGPNGTSGKCPGDDTWDQWTLREVPTARRGHTAVWTGNVMVVWGGFGQTSFVNTGSRYDPATDTWLSSSTAGAPAARQSHRAVWTGTSMVVWGGRGTANVYLGDGGRYDPVADSWLPVSLVGAPAPRLSFTAIWTGSRMVVWGGSNQSGFTPVGGQYDPVADTWATTSTVDAPAPRVGHSAVWTGSRMIVWGGGFTSALTATGGLYDPANDTWTSTSMLNTPAARSGHSAVWTGSVMIVWGGSAPSMFSSGGRYDPINDTWTATSMANTPSIRSAPIAIWSGTAMIAWGGSLFDSPSQTISYPTDGGRYDPVSDTWTPTSLIGAPSGRSSLTPIWTGNSMIVWGGARDEGPDFTTHYLDTGARYDPSTDTWTPTSLAGTPRARTEHSAIWTGSVMVIWGGTNGNADFDSGGRYDPVTDDWAGTSSLNAPTGRYLHSAVWTGNAMLIWGGESRSNPPYGDLDTGGTYDPIADTWAPISTIGAPSKRAGQPTVWTGREMLVWGGFNNGTYPTTGGRYNPFTDTWSSMSTQGTPSGRYYASAVWTGHFFVVWGGNGGVQPFNTGGRYDPSNDRWIATSLVEAPAGRWVHSTIWTGHAMVIWGGFDSSGGGGLQTGARYDPVADTWTATSTIGAPAARGGHAAVWTGRDMLLWGGYGGAYLGTGARYDPSSDTWTPTSTVGAPSVRTGPSAVWDGSQMLVWGGYENASPFILLDTGGSYRATPGESCNGVDDDCDGSVDEGGDALCDDNNPCTDDACNGSAGCAFIANVDPCDDYNPCTGPDACGGGVCSGTPLTGTSCDDGNACTTADTCAAGECAGGPQRICDDGNACTDDACDPVTGCVVLGPRTCDDNEVCTDDSCDPATGCVFAPNDNNPCDDYSYCTTGETCRGGHCVAPELPCEDHNPCTDDVCDGYYCHHVANSALCNDGYECTANDTCSDGYCMGTPTYGESCDDHNACSSDDVCQGYFCYGTYRECDDGNSCTDDGCDPQSGECVYFNHDGVYCTDGNACTIGESCHAGVCTGSAPVDCYGCPAGFEELGRFCRRTMNMSADNLFNQNHACDLDGTSRYNDCEGGTYGFVLFDLGANLVPVDIDLQFMSGISCDSGISQVSLNGTPIGTFTPLGSCECFPLRSLVSFPNIDVNAYLPGEVNTISIAPSGGCEGLTKFDGLDRYYGRVTVTYARHDPRCDVGSCDPATGVCNFSSFPDGTVCGDACSDSGLCLGGSCNVNAINCDDKNACTTDSCNPATGCIHANNPSACDDGNECTTDDACSGGACLGTPVPLPEEVPSVFASKSARAATFTWDEAVGATAYDVLRGSVHDWPVGSKPATETCLANNMAALSASDDTVVQAGDGYWYLVRGASACGSGSYGSPQMEGLPTIPRRSTACP